MDYPQLELAEFKGPKAIFETSEGHFEIALFPKQAPKTVDNFIGLAKRVLRWPDFSPHHCRFYDSRRRPDRHGNGRRKPVGQTL